MIATLMEEVQKPSHSWPTDLIDAFGERAGRAMFPRLLSRFGELLCAWPRLMRSARELREEGTRLAVAL